MAYDNSVLFSCLRFKKKKTIAVTNGDVQLHAVQGLYCYYMASCSYTAKSSSLQTNINSVHQATTRVMRAAQGISAAAGQ
jgi:hypothetical protein